MAGGNRSSLKGDRAERELCKLLSTVFGGSFIRVPNSGAYIGGKNRARRDLLSEGQVRAAKGDIVPPDFMPKLTIESKWYKEFPFHALLTAGRVPMLEDWLDQLDMVTHDDDLALLAFKIDRRSWFVAYNEAQNLVATNHSLYHHRDGRRFVITGMNEFLDRNKDRILILSG